MIARLACARAKAAGIPLPALLKKAHLTVQQIEDVQVRIPARDQVRLLNLIAEAVPDDLLGLHLAEQGDLRDMGLLYYVLASSATLAEAVRRAVRYGELVNEGVFQHCTIGKHVSVGFRYVGVSRHLDRHQAESWMLLIVRLLRQLTGVRVSPRRVAFVHARPKVPREFAPYFGRHVEFGAGADEISFAGTIGSLPVVGADPYLNRHLVRHYEEVLARRAPSRGSFRATVENAIVPRLPHAEVRIGEIAGQLGMGARTLARRLGAEGLTFSGLLGELRRELAIRYLADVGTTISQVAWLLGYQEVSAFSKAFKRWTGEAPRVARARVAPGG